MIKIYLNLGCEAISGSHDITNKFLHIIKNFLFSLLHRRTHHFLIHRVTEKKHHNVYFMSHDIHPHLNVLGHMGLFTVWMCE